HRDGPTSNRSVLRNCGIWPAPRNSSRRVVCAARVGWSRRPYQMTAKLFSELGLSPELLKAIDKLGFEQAAPIQAEAIPLLMQGRDVVGQSQTGSGKTAAFAVPAIEKVDPDNRATQI